MNIAMMARKPSLSLASVHMRRKTNLCLRVLGLCRLPEKQKERAGRSETPQHTHQSLLGCCPWFLIIDSDGSGNGLCGGAQRSAGGLLVVLLTLTSPIGQNNQV